MKTNTVDGKAEVTPGVLDRAAVRAFTRGQCAGLARALRERTGWPFVIAIYTGRSGQEGIHVYVQEKPESPLIDILGAQSTETARRRLEQQGASGVEFGRGGPDALNDFIKHGLIEPGDLDLARTFVDPVLNLAAR